MAIVIGLSTTANCQSRNDSSVIANKDLRKAAILIEQGKRCIVEVELLNKSVNLLEQRVALKDSSITAFKKIVSAQDSIIQNYKKTDAIYSEMLRVKKKDFTKRLRREKVKTWIAGGVVVTLLYLLVK